MSDKFPIIFVHNGNSNYLKYSLHQAKIMNPEAEIILLGDEKNNKYDFVSHFLIRDFYMSASEFEIAYLHLSTNNYQIELFCFQRWFVIREFLESIKKEQFCYLDSDVLIFTDLLSCFQNIKGVDITVCNKIGPQYTFISSKNVLDRFCHFIFSMFTDEKLKAHYIQFFNERKSKGLEGGVSDMLAVADFIGASSLSVLDLGDIRSGTVFDDNISFSQGFEMGERGKKIYWENGAPYGKHLETGEIIRFNALHFQGPAKSEIDKYYTGKNFRWDRFKRRFRRFRKGMK
ncbi:MAG: hypothetical protein ACJ75J_06910 [Cytophagaceae bacterium]